MPNPEKVYFIQGCFIEEGDQFVRDGYYGILMIDPDCPEETEDSPHVRVRIFFFMFTVARCALRSVFWGKFQKSPN